MDLAHSNPLKIAIIMIITFRIKMQVERKETIRNNRKKGDTVTKILRF